MTEKDSATLYAVVDAARSDKVLVRLVDAQSSCPSLFAGTDREPLFSAGPFLVSPWEDADLFEWLTTEAWGAAMVVFLTSQAPYGQVLHHLQSLLKAVTEEDAEVLFRYYDPRVLRTYLSSCDAASAWRFMGPVVHWMAESDAGDELLCWQRETADNLPPDHDPVWRQPPFITAGQLQRFRQTSLADYHADLKAHLKSRFARQISAYRLDDVDLSRLITDGMDRARMYGIRSRFDVRRFVEYMLLIDPDFDLNPDCQWAGRIIFTNGITGREKMDLLDRAVVLRTLQAQRDRSATEDAA